MSETNRGAAPSPLDGIRVVDLTRALAGPFCTALLGDLGADVIKVEGLPHGDATRAWPPFDGDRSLYYLSANRNKRSIAVDLRSQRGKSVVADLVEGADVLVENFRPGVLARLGVHPDQLQEVRPDLVIASISGFGEVGPLRQDAGLDQIAQGMSGLMSVTGAGENTPMRVGVPIIDMVAGMYSALGIVASLAARAAGRPASRVSTSLLESAVSIMTFQAQRFLSLGEVATAQGNDHPLISPYGTFRACDTNFNVAVGTETQWRSLCRLLGRPDLAETAQFRDPETRTKHRAALYDELNRLLATESAEHWLGLLRQEGIPCGPIYRMDQVFADPQVHALGMVQTIPNGAGEDVLLRGPVGMNGRPPSIRRHPPRLGEHSREILLELGYQGIVVDELVSSGVVAQPHNSARQ